MASAGKLAIVLHAHLPFDADEGRRAEALAASALLVDHLRALRADGVALQLTLAISPSFGAMLRDADLAGAFGDLQASGHVELVGSAATHAFLPALVHTPRSAAAQLALGCRQHAALFGHRPRGLWLPGCGWTPELDEVLAAEGVRFVVVAERGLLHAAPRPVLGIHAPVFTPAGVAAFAIGQAASAALGTDAPTPAPFAALLTGTTPHTGGAPQAPVERPPIIVAVRNSTRGDDLAPRLDAFFRHPAWKDADLGAVTLAGYLEAHPVQQSALPAASACGVQGDPDAWVDPSRSWTNRHAHRASHLMTAMARAHPDADGALRRALGQAARALLLLEATDGPLPRAQQHLATFRKLSRMIRAQSIDEAWLSALEAQPPALAGVDFRLYG